MTCLFCECSSISSHYLPWNSPQSLLLGISQAAHLFAQLIEGIFRAGHFFGCPILERTQGTLTLDQFPPKPASAAEFFHRKTKSLLAL